MKRLRPRSVAVGVLALVVAAALAKAGATLHVRHVTGVREVAHTNCITCHGSGAPLEYARGTEHPTPEDIAAAPDGATLYVACGRARRVAVVDVAGRALLRWIEVPGEAAGVAVSPDGATLAVALDDTRAVLFFDAHDGTPRGRVRVGLEPSGVAFGGDGATLFVANAGSADVSLVDVAARRERLRVPAGREPFRVARAPDGTRMAVVSRMASLVRADEEPWSELTLLDAETGRVERRVRLPSCHQAEGLTFSADGARVFVPSLHVRNLLPIAQVARGWVVSGVLCSVDAGTGDVAVLPLGTVNRPFADPAGIAVAPDGTRAWIASGGNDSVVALDVAAALGCEAACAPASPEPLALAHTYLGIRAATGSRPGGVALAGGLVAVAERLDDALVLLRADDLGVAARIPLGPHIPDDAVQRGARVFHSARYAFQGAFACRSCHPGAHTDGLTYDFDIDGVGRDIVLNRSLRGVKGTAPFKWTGLNPTLARQCGARFAMVLTRADVMPDAGVEDLVAYLESLPPPRATGGNETVLGFRDEAVERGRAIFFRTATKKGAPIPPEGRCSTCHAGPHYSNLQSADVHTQSPLDHTGTYDVPHLTGIGRKAPYLHDGRALSLEEIWTLPGVEDHHGVVTDLNKTDLNDLVEFLRSL